MITAAQIMAGELPTSSREFTVEGVGKLVLHRLPATEEVKARQLFTDKDADPAKLEEMAQRNTYYMLHGQFNDKEAAKLPQLLDVHQLGMIHTTGLFFTNLTQEHLEETEKN
ncbi:hypothetical protein [Pseudoalteromonas sp. T1lg22]|uniref:hypothetical protein n=1 Tax=Pseudoalteromonas sp. T1lg22 TaxID=2077096 RepID=UPI000CF70135|nr:hypothetical protein [Pseudoalteromonas sp. T1lg22]